MANVIYDNRSANHICQSSSYQEEGTEESGGDHQGILAVFAQTSSPLGQEVAPVETENSLRKHPLGDL